MTPLEPSTTPKEMKRMPHDYPAITLLVRPQTGRKPSLPTRPYLNPASPPPNRTSPAERLTRHYLRCVRQCGYDTHLFEVHPDYSPQKWEATATDTSGTVRYVAKSDSRLGAAYGLANQLGITAKRD